MLIEIYSLRNIHWNKKCIQDDILILGQIAPPKGDTSSAQTICFTKHSNQLEHQMSVLWGYR